MKPQLAGCSGGIHILGHALEGHALRLQLGDSCNQVSEGAVKPVEAPDHKGIAFTKMGERFPQARAFHFGPGDFIGIDVFRTTLGFDQSVALQVKVLLNLPALRLDGATPC